MTEHTCPKHQPGSAACAHRHGCPCQPCRAARYRQQKHAKHDAAAGRPHYVDATPVVAHVRNLLAGGCSIDAVAKASNTAHSTITRMLNGHSRRVQPDTARRLLNVPLTQAAAHNGYVPLALTVRRTDALALQGWSLAELSRRAGLHDGALGDAIGTSQGTLRRTTFNAVQALYANLWDKQAPPCRSTTHTRLAAQRRGAVPALAWDEGTGPHGIDNPNATPHGHQQRGKRPQVDCDELAWLLEQGLTPAEVADQLGRPLEALVKSVRYAEKKTRAAGDVWHHGTLASQLAASPNLRMGHIKTVRRGAA